MAEMSYGIVLGIMGGFAAVWAIIVKMLWSKFNNVQYKDNCVEIVKRIDERADERHEAITKSLENIENLIKNGGNPHGRDGT